VRETKEIDGVERIDRGTVRRGMEKDRRSVEAN
jgi:hypothetical protein